MPFSVKGVNFFGDKSQFIVSGSDCGHVFIWDKQTGSIVNFFRGDENGVVRHLSLHLFS
jgi:WD repeat-containing protein 42A